MSQDIQRMRASGWAGWFDCAHRMEGITLLGMTNTVGMRAIMGTALHKSTAVYDQSVIDGDGLTPYDAAEALIAVLHNPGEGYFPIASDPSMREAERVCLDLHGQYCEDWSPKFDWQHVELETEPFDIDCGGGLVIRLTGTMDRGRVQKGTDGKSSVTDLKSGATAVQKGAATTVKHKAQVGTYELLTEHTLGVEVSGESTIVGLKTKGKPEIAETTISGSKLAMVGDGEHTGLLTYAAQMFRSGHFPPNPSSMICSKQYCPRWNYCIYHG